MNRIAACLLALAILSSAAVPAGAQTGGVPVKNALVVVTDSDAGELQRLLSSGGTPSNVEKMVAAAESLLSATAYRTLTDQAGRFEVQAPLAAGAYNATVFAPGYVSQQGPSTVSVAGEGAQQNVTFYLQPSAVLSGKVTDGAGRPIPGIVVAAGSRNSANYDVTMDDGVFVLDTGLAAGEHTIFAFKPAAANVSRLQELYSGINLPIESRVPQFIRHDSAGYVSYQSNVTLEQGKLSVLDIRLERSNTIAGRVTDSASRPIAGVAVLAFAAGSDDVRSLAITDAAGNYTLDNDLASGQYTILVPSIFSGGHAPYSANVTVPAAKPADIVLLNSTALEGTVVDANGRPVEGAGIFAIDKQSAGAASVREFLAGSMGKATSDGNGRFVIDSGLANATYIAIASFGNIPVSSSVQIKAGGGPAQIKLGFTGVVSVSGVVKDPSGAPVEKAVVAPGFASEISAASPLAVTTGPQGQFTLQLPVNSTSGKAPDDEVLIAAPGYETVTAQVQERMNVILDRIGTASILGRAVAADSAQPPVEVALSRQGTMLLSYNGSAYPVGVHTNSRVVNASFDQPAKSVVMELEGVQGAAGLTELAIPKDMIGGPYAVSLDGAPVQNFTVSENGTHSVIGVKHDHGAKSLVVQGATAVPEFPAVGVAMLVAMSALIGYGRARGLRTGSRRSTGRRLS